VKAYIGNLATVFVRAGSGYSSGLVTSQLVDRLCYSGGPCFYHGSICASRSVIALRQGAWSTPTSNTD